jgi:PKD repeat protein
MSRSFVSSWWQRKANDRAAARKSRAASRRVQLGLESLEERVVMNGSLVAAYNFDAGSGTTLADVSGNGNNGTINNATWTTGKYGSALQFTGKTNSYVSVPSSAALNLTKGMTLEAWVDPTSLNSPDNGWASAISKAHYNSSNDVSYALYAAQGTGVGPGPQVLVGGQDQGPTGGSVVPLNQWTFLASTYDGTTLKMYVNGNLVASQALSGNIATTSNPLTIGGDWSGEMFTGKIDNVRIYNYALSQTQLKTDMNTAVTAAVSAPAVTAVSPANNATGVAVTSPVTLTFNEALNSSTVNSNTVELLNSAGAAVAAAVTYNSANNTVTLTPSSALAYSSTYTVLACGGTSGAVIQDASGHAMTANFNSTFTTVAPPPPPVANAGPNETANEGTAVAFNGSVTGGTTPLTVQWSFGDGGTASGSLKPTHTYAEAGTYTATLTVTDAQGRTSQSSDTVTVNDVTPTANANGAYTGTAGTAIALTGSMTDSPADIAAGCQWWWNFGDGSTSSLQNPSHTYANAGTYNVTLTVKDADGLTATSTTTATVNALSPPPVANAGPNKTANEGTAVTFAGSVTGGTTPLTYQWTFGDGGTASGSLTPTHTYAEAGTYTATLTVTDAQGRTSQSSDTVTVTDVTPTANANGAYTGSPGTAVAFSGSATDSPADTTAGFTWAWAFGDGSTSSVQNPSHTYANAGTYTVTLTVTNADGLTATSTSTATVSSQSIQPITTPTITTNYLTIPNFGAKPTIYSVKSGNWNDPTVWSLGRVPVAGDIVDVNPGTTVTYNVNDATNSTPYNTVEVQPTATLTFATNINTQICVGNFLVLPGGTLDVGTAANPIATNVNCNIDIANQAINTANDPNQFGTGLIVLGNVSMHGAVTTPYATLAQEPHAGDTVLHLASPVTNWQPGMDIFLPDTRQLDYGGGGSYQSEFEVANIQSISADGLTVTLTAPLKYDHLGAHDANGVLRYLPQVMNNNRNIMISSASFTGTRGYTLFSGNGNVDVEYAGFCELGRTTNNPTGSSNVADRYAMTVLDLIGPSSPQANGYQYTFIGNEVDNDGDGNPKNPSNIQWGLAVNNSYYGLIQYNTVNNVAGAGIGVEDNASSYNTFDHNFVLGVIGDGVNGDMQLRGSGFWFGNPNNYITNNIATDINAPVLTGFGFDIDATYAGTNTVAAYQGADPSVAGQGVSVNMNDTPILALSGNEAYGAMQGGMTLWWIGTFGDTYYSDAKPSVVKNFVAWNIGTLGWYGYPTNNLTIDGAVILGDANLESNGYNYSQGIGFSDYMTHNLTIQNCTIEDMYTGIQAPFMVGRDSNMSTTIIQNCFLENTVNIDIEPARSVNGSSGLSPQTIDIINVQFANDSQAQPSWCANISMNYITSDSVGTSNMSVPQYVYVTNYNDVQGDNFQVFYTQSNSPTGKPPANAKTRSGIDGLVLPD